MAPPDDPNIATDWPTLDRRPEASLGVALPRNAGRRVRLLASKACMRRWTTYQLRARILAPVARAGSLCVRGHSRVCRCDGKNDRAVEDLANRPGRIDNRQQARQHCQDERPDETAGVPATPTKYRRSADHRRRY